MLAALFFSACIALMLCSTALSFRLGGGGSGARPRTSRMGHARVMMSENTGTEVLAVPIPVLSDLKRMNTKAALNAVCGGSVLLTKEKLYEEGSVNVLKSAPTVNRFVIANPKALLENPQIAKSLGVDFTSMDPNSPLTDLAKILPVIYIADVHSEYGTLGFMLNNHDGKTMNDVKPEFRYFRERKVYNGGVQNRGSSFTMLHRRAGFPENRVLRCLPDTPEFRLFFSPDIAMANELCSTKDATLDEFKFFVWSTIWLPKQLDLEYDKKVWLTIDAPVDVIFENDTPFYPLWRRLVASLPKELLGRK